MSWSVNHESESTSKCEGKREYVSSQLQADVGETICGLLKQTLFARVTTEGGYELALWKHEDEEEENLGENLANVKALTAPVVVA